MTWAERVEFAALRVACRALGLHGRACRGRTDHASPDLWEHPGRSGAWRGRGRWVRWL